MKVFLDNPKMTLLLSNVLNFLFCWVILVYIRYILQAKTVSVSRRAFKRLVVFVMLCLVADMLSYVFDMHPSSFAKVMNHISMFFAVSLTAFVGYLWNDLLDSLFHIKRTDQSLTLHRIAWLIPTVLTVVLLTVNLFTGCIYTIDQDNVYHRGSLYFLSFFLQYISFAYAVLRALLIKVRAPIAPMKREKMRRTVVCFGFVVLFFGCLQWLMNGKIAVHCMGLTAGVIIMFVRFLDNQITQDRLTDLNNRYALDTYMAERIRIYDSRTRSHKLFFILMDVNGFKTINDRYGHVEGDNALKCLAEVLKGIANKNPRSIFVARYGGDEFAAVLEAKDEAAIEHFVKEVSSALGKKTDDRRYRLSVSIGYSVYKGSEMSVSEWIHEADSDLYRKKRSAADGELL